MSSNNNKINNINIPNPEQISGNSQSMPGEITSTGLNQTNNNGLNAETNKGISQKNILTSTKSLIIIGASVLLVSAIIVLIIVLTTKKNKKRSSIIITNNGTDVEIGEPKISYDEAEELIGSEKIKENHMLLNKSLNDLNELIWTANNTNFSLLNTTIGELPENLDFLNNTNDSALLVAKQDLDLYIESLSAIPERVNNLSKEMSKIMKNISDSLITYKNDIDKKSKQFELNMRYLAIPLSSNSSSLRNLENDETLKKYKEELNKLDNVYNNDLTN